MSGERVTAEGKAQGRPAEPSADDLEQLARELVRRLGPRAAFLASLIDEAAAEAAEAG
jgi:hypothetical protein